MLVVEQVGLAMVMVPVVLLTVVELILLLVTLIKVEAGVEHPLREH